MYSVYGDTVLDPFVGTGTTMAAAVAAARSSVGIEFSAGLAPLVEESLLAGGKDSTALAKNRLNAHADFVSKRLAEKKILKYENLPHGFPVMTRQEVAMSLQVTSHIRNVDTMCFEATHAALNSD
jgi:hypothetical protein